MSELCNNCGHPEHDHGGFSNGHRANGRCHWQQRGGLVACHCESFVSPTAEAVAALPYEEQKLLACSNYWGIEPSRISWVKTVTDGHNRVVGIDMIVRVPMDQQTVAEWVRKNTPKEGYDWVVKYLEERPVTDDQEKKSSYPALEELGLSAEVLRKLSNCETTDVNTLISYRSKTYLREKLGSVMVDEIQTKLEEMNLKLLVP